MTEEQADCIINFINVKVTTHWLIDHEGVTYKGSVRLLNNLKTAENNLRNVLINKPKQGDNNASQEKGS